MKRLLLLVPLALTCLAQATMEKDIVYGQSQGVDLKLDLVRPEGAGPFPAVICIHGGAWQSGSKSGYAAILPMLASNGYVAASIEYRFAPQYKFPAQIEDVRRAVEFLKSHAAEYKIDPKRIAALGDSAGGHLALLLGLQDTPSRVHAVVNLSGPSDIARWKADPEGEKAIQMTSDELLSRVFGTSDRTSAVLRAASPISLIGKTGAAVLTFHGDSDTVVKLEQSEWLHKALAGAGIAEKLVVIKGAGHGFRPEDIASISQTTIAFLASQLKQAPGGLPATEAVVGRYFEALGGISALQKVQSRVLNGTFEVPTFGASGKFSEFAKTPGKVIQKFDVVNYGVVQRCVDGKTAWAESPESGVEDLSGIRAAEVRRTNGILWPSIVGTLYSKLTVTGRAKAGDRDSIVIEAVGASGIADKLLFDAETGLLVRLESKETAGNGEVTPFTMSYEDYRAVDGVKVPHVIRYESAAMTWIIRLQSVVHGAAVDDAKFLKPGA